MLKRERLKPLFSKSPRNFIERRIFGAIDATNWSANRYIHEARRDGLTVSKKHQPPRFYHSAKSSSCYVRIERQETATELAKALFYYADRTLQGTYIFEVRLGAIELAKAVSQLHPHDRSNGRRMSYEPVRNCLNEFIRAGLLVEVTGWNQTANQRCAKRYFLTPEFFKSFYFRVEDLMQHIQKRYDRLTPMQRQQELENYHLMQERINARRSIAKIRSRALDRKLKQLRHRFITYVPQTAISESPATDTRSLQDLEIELSNVIKVGRELGLINHITKIVASLPIKTEPIERRRRLLDVLQKLTSLIH